MKSGMMRKVFAVYIIFLLTLLSVSPMVQGIFGWDITATAGANGIINPSGIVHVDDGGDKLFTITANPGFHVLDVVVDSVSQGAISSYEFLNVLADHTITAYFEIDASGSAFSASSGDYLGYIDEIIEIEDATDPSYSVGFSINGTYVFYARFEDYLARHSKGNVTAKYEVAGCDTQQTYAIDVSPNGTYVAFSGYPTGIPGFDIYRVVDDDGKPEFNWVASFDAEPTTVYDIKFSANNSYIAYVGTGTSIYIRNTSTWALKETITPGDPDDCLDWSPNYKWLAIGAQDSNEAYVYNAKSFTHNKTIGSTNDDVEDVAFSHDSQWLAVAGNRGLKVYDTNDAFSLEATLTCSLASFTWPNQTYAVGFSADDNYLFAMHRDGILSAYNTNTWTRDYSYDFDSTVVYDMDVCENGTLLAIADDSSIDAKMLTIFPANRTYGTYIEYNNASFVLPTNMTGERNLVIAVSANSTGVSSVHNNEVGVYATQVYSRDLLVDNNTFYYDLANYTVYIRADNLLSGTIMNWTVITTHDICFDVSIPEYLNVGDYFLSSGHISDSNGSSLDGVIATTRVLFANGTNAITPMKWNCSGGNYQSIFSTNTLESGTYYVTITFPDPLSGETLKKQSVLYLSIDPGAGVYVATKLNFKFYNNNTGIGILPERFKIYVDTDTSLNRLYKDTYNIHTGKIVYYRIDDYFDNQVYPASGSYKSLLITSVEQYEDIPIDWYDVAVKNLNDTIILFSMENGSVFYNITLFPMDTYHFTVLPGIYNITKISYHAKNGTLIKTETDEINVSADTFYVCSGYTAHLFFSLYNTNEALGIPWDTIKYYANGKRLTEREYHTYINATINLTVKDYYNQTLYWGNFTLNSSYTFLDFGLTFHSYKFGNLNNEYYMISFLRDGGSRWFERGIMPYGELEFLLPSGDYSLRIYDADGTDVYTNSSVHMVNSRLYVINGSHLELVINGQSVITGYLLELNQKTQPSLVKVGYNIPFIRSCYDRECQLDELLGENITKICPPQILIATTYNNTYTNRLVHPLVPTNTTVNGTITVPDTDKLWFHSNGSWVNVSHENGTLIKNTSYAPTFVKLNGWPTVWINSSNNISLTRESRYHQVREFYWTKYTDLNKYEATVNFTNPLNDPIENVYLYIAFADDGETPDYGSLTVYDVTNTMTLTEGEHFDSSSKGIHMSVSSMNAGSSRQFRCTYYISEENIQPSDAIVVLEDFGDMREHLGKNYYYLRSSWINRNSESFLGPIYIQFNFTLPQSISRESIDIWDDIHLRYLYTDEFAYTPGGFIISQDAVGKVPSQSARTYDIYYLYAGDIEVSNVVLGFLHDEIIPFVPLIGPVLGVHVAIFVLLIFGIVSYMISDERKPILHRTVWLSVSLIFIFLIFLAWLQPLV